MAKWHAARGALPAWFSPTLPDASPPPPWPLALQVQRATAGVGRVAERWRVFGALWRTDRAAALAKLRWVGRGKRVEERGAGLGLPAWQEPVPVA